ncbi:MAG: YtxH domain-containing protein [Bacillota bacterium]|jgi:gas vesicle protein
MRRHLLTGMIIGGLIGTYYGMTMSRQNQRRLTNMADNLIDRGSDMAGMIKDRATDLMDRVR